MDIQKEREAFEALQNQKIFKWFEFDLSVDAYVLKGIPATLEKLTALAELNYGWDMWQAAKARSIPEGFVVVPKEPTQKMLNAGHVVMNPIKGSLVQAGTNQKRRDCYKAMIEAAQEPTND